MNYSLLVLLFFFKVNLYSQHYAIKSVELGHIEINSDFDSKVNYGLISNYKSAVDAVMSHILGKSADYMDASRPESLLSNWVAKRTYSQMRKNACFVGIIRVSMECIIE